jgi:hypothetical protein
MSSKRLDAMVYSGQHTEAVFLKSLLEGSGIQAELSNLAVSGDDEVGVYVAQSDAADAIPLVEDFRNHGTKTPGFFRQGVEGEPVSQNRRGRRRYEDLIAAVAGVLDDTDPVGLLQHGGPSDEYSAEVETIVARVSRASDAVEVKGIVHEEFVHWFGTNAAGHPDAYDSMAKRIWDAVVHHRAG